MYFEVIDNRVILLETKIFFNNLENKVTNWSMMEAFVVEGLYTAGIINVALFSINLSSLFTFILRFNYFKFGTLNYNKFQSN